jgi:hypothetical protein
VANVHDYLRLASEAKDLAAWMQDPELAASYHRLADSYQRLARFKDQLSALLINTMEMIATPKRAPTSRTRRSPAAFG